MENSTRFVVHGLCGAFLAALVAIVALFAGDGVSWPFVAICAAAGLVIAGVIGKRGLQFLADVLQHV